MTAPQVIIADTEDAQRDRRAVALIVLAMAAFSTQDVLVKVVLEQASVWQAQLIRSLAVVALISAVATAMGKSRDLRPARFLWPVIRAIFMCGAYVFFYASLPFLSLSQASAAFFIGPILITLLAALFLGEPIGPRRIAAIVVGFLGVLCIVQPGGDLNLASLMPVAAALSYAFGVVITRWRCRADPAFALSIMHNAFYAVVAVLAVVALELWSPVEAREAYPALAIGWAEITALAWLLILITALTHTIGIMSSTVAYQMSDASRLAPFEYSYLAMAPIWDAMIWGRVPSPSTALGMLLIAGAGGFVAWREGRPARARPQNYGEVPWTDESTTPIPDREAQ